MRMLFFLGVLVNCRALYQSSNIVPYVFTIDYKLEGGINVDMYISTTALNYIMATKKDNFVGYNHVNRKVININMMITKKRIMLVIVFIYLQNVGYSYASSKVKSASKGINIQESYFKTLHINNKYLEFLKYKNGVR